MSLPYWIDHKQKRQTLHCDVCIVGGGISGLSTAYWLQKEDPNLRIVLLEKSLVGHGASGRNAGFITCGSVEHFNRMVSKHGEEQATEIWRFAEQNLKLLKEEIIQDQHINIDFNQQGAFSLAASQSELSELEKVAQLMGRHSIPVESVNGQQVEKRVGAVGFTGGIKYLDDGEVNPMALLQLLRAKLKAQILENTEAHRVLTLSSGERLVKASGVDVKTTLVVYALNGYSSSIDSFFADKVFPTRGQIMMLEPVDSSMEAPCYANFYLDYFRQLSDGALLIGGFRQLEADTEKGFSEHTTEKIQQALHDFVNHHLPKFKQAAITHRWAGVMGFSVDGEPLVGAIPTDPQCFFMAGFTGHGLGMAFHSAKKLVDVIFDRKIPDWLSSKRL